ncbi:MAG: hypothetical protein ACE15C_10670 [Phycisphaerae bacterium]
MHTIKCPKCGKTLRMDRAVQNARLKCRSCGQVFVGTSQEVPEPAAPPPRAPVQAAPRAAQPSEPAGGPIPFAEQPPYAPPPVARPAGASTPAPAPRPLAPAPAPAAPIDALGASLGGQHRAYAPTKPKRSMAQAVIAIVGLVVILGVVIGLVWLLGHEHVILTDADGKTVLVDRWVTRQEAARLREEVLAAKEGRTATPAPLPTGAVPRPTAAGGPTPTPADPGLPKYEGDSKIFVELNQEPVSELGSDRGYFVGTVRNKYTCPVSALVITLRYWEPSARQIVPIGQPVTCQNLAPNGVTGFSVAYDGYTAEEAKKIPLTIKVTNVMTQDDRIGFDLPRDDFGGTMSEDGKTFNVSGKIKNTTPYQLGQMEVYADLFTDDGLYIATVKGELAKGVSDLRPSEPGKRPDWVDFTITYTLTSASRPSGSKLYVRVIGSKT